MAFDYRFHARGGWVVADGQQARLLSAYCSRGTEHVVVQDREALL
jgi:hypothetical protein